MDLLKIAARVASTRTAAGPRTVKGEITLTIEVVDEQPDMGRSDEELLMSAAETLAEGAGDNSWAGDGAYVTGVAGVRVDARVASTRTAVPEGGGGKMAKYVVLWSDGGNGLQNGGYADELPEGAFEMSPGVYGMGEGSIADGDPVYAEVLGKKYLPEEPEEDPGAPSDLGPNYDTLEEKKGLK